MWSFLAMRWKRGIRPLEGSPGVGDFRIGGFFRWGDVRSRPGGSDGLTYVVKFEFDGRLQSYVAGL